MFKTAAFEVFLAIEHLFDASVLVGNVPLQLAVATVSSVLAEIRTSKPGCAEAAFGERAAFDHLLKPPDSFGAVRVSSTRSGF